MKKTILTVALALALTVTSVYALTMTLDVDELKDLAGAGDMNLGAMSSPDVYFPATFYEGIVVGGGIYATSTAIDGSVLSAKEITDYAQIDMLYTGDGGADGLFTTTLPASTTLVSFLPEAGMCTTRILRNTHATAASSTTITAGTGIVLMEHTAAAETLNGGNDSVMTWCREFNGTGRGDFTVKLEEYTDI